MTARGVLRIGLCIVAATLALVGAWALPAPRAFYDGFPTAGHAWVALLPPYNEHLVRDVGAFGLALTVMLGAAAVWPERRLVRVALVGGCPPTRRRQAPRRSTRVDHGGNVAC